LNRWRSEGGCRRFGSSFEQGRDRSDVVATVGIPAIFGGMKSPAQRSVSPAFICSVDRRLSLQKQLHRIHIRAAGGPMQTGLPVVRKRRIDLHAALE